MRPENLSCVGTPIEVDTTRLQVFDDLVAGSRDAVALIYERFLPCLLREAEKRIPPHLRGQIMAESVMHSMIGSLLDMNEEQRKGWSHYRVTNWGCLYGILATIVARKTLNRVRALQTEKRDVTRQVAFDPTNILAGGADPQAVADYNDLVQQVFGRLDATEQRILGLRMEGRSDAQIVKETGLVATVVAEVFRKTKRFLQRKIDEQTNG